MMMEILFNELSLTGQFSNQEDFITKGLLPFNAVLKEIEGFSCHLLTKTDTWNHKVTPSDTLHSLLMSRSDEIRRLKSAIVRLTKGPFWDNDTKQCPENTYLLNGMDIRDSAPAEACERDQTLISFVASDKSINPLNVIKNGENIPLFNLMNSGCLSEFLWDKEKISFELFLKSQFFKEKLDFSQVDKTMDFSVVQPSEYNIFIETFKKFNKLNWEQIYNDKGLNYKEYHGMIGTKYRGMRTYKFRVSQKFRCHGWREKDRFIVIGFETDHELSNRG